MAVPLYEQQWLLGRLRTQIVPLMRIVATPLGQLAPPMRKLEPQRHHIRLWCHRGPVAHGQRVAFDGLERAPYVDEDDATAREPFSLLGIGHGGLQGFQRTLGCEV